jgi:hypothetical protein
MWEHELLKMQCEDRYAYLRPVTVKEESNDSTNAVGFGLTARADLKSPRG